MATKIIRFNVFINLNANTPLLPFCLGWKKNPWPNSIEILSWYFHVRFFSCLVPDCALALFIALDANIRNPFYSCFLFSSGYSLLQEHQDTIHSFKLSDPFMLVVLQTQTGLQGLLCHSPCSIQVNLLVLWDIQITERSGLEGTWKAISFQPPAKFRGTFH